MKSCQSLFLAAVISAGTLLVPAQAEGGPLLDWLRGLRQKSCLNRQAPCNTCQTGVMGNALASANPYNLQPGQCATTCNQTCARTVVNYVPQTAYRCSWEQVPVTQYKPVTNSDPCTGCSVTCMKPCTTYTWQQKQVPYTTYRAVYRTENYTVPVTTISNSGECATCGVPGTSGCATCGVPGTTVNPGTTFDPGTIQPPPAGTSAPIYGNPPASSTYPYPAPGNVIPSNGTTTSIISPNGTISTSGSYGTDPYSGTPTPADRVPSIDGINPQTMQRPILDMLRGTRPENNTMMGQPRNAVLPGGVTLDQASNTNLRRDWGYSPVRLASYSQPAVATGSDWTVSANVPESNRMSRAESVQSTLSNQEPVNSSWRTVGW